MLAFLLAKKMDRYANFGPRNLQIDEETVFKSLAEELKLLVEDGNYSPRYYSIHRTIFNLCCSGCDFEEHAKHFKILPTADYRALRTYLYPFSYAYEYDDGQTPPSIVRPIVKSAENENDLLTPDSRGNYNIHLLSYLHIPKHILAISENPAFFLRAWTENPERLDYLDKFMEYSEKEYYQNYQFPRFGASILYQKFKEMESRLSEANKRLELLENRPPHLIECPKCEEPLEIHCSEETEFLKEHFNRLSTSTPE